MVTFTIRENVVFGSKHQLPSSKEPDLLVYNKRGTLTTVEFKRERTEMAPSMFRAVPR